ncbi:MAG: zinc-ribbon domain-containing protein [Clostridiales bacterium]|nr:zinc-ribbon domain-containing protein [Clostridiales bacterium]
MGKNFGEYNRLNKVGNSVPMVCPKCKNEVTFHISKAYSNLKVIFLTMGEYDINYFATCPECASVYKLPNSLGEKIENGSCEEFELNLQMLASNKLI